MPEVWISVGFAIPRYAEDAVSTFSAHFPEQILSYLQYNDGTIMIEW